MEGVKALRCTRLTLNFRAKFLLYNGYFKSHAEFCAITYLDKLNKKQLNELYLLQKQAIRLVFSARKNVHTSKLFKLAGVVPLNKLYETESIKLVYKNMLDPSSNDQPIAIKNLLITQNHDSARLYGNQNKIKIPSHYKKTHGFFNILEQWNKCRPEFKTCGNLWSLKRMLKEEFLQSIPVCGIKNCSTCLLDREKNY